jgi:hypothetical protein
VTAGAAVGNVGLEVNTAGTTLVRVRTSAAEHAGPHAGDVGAERGRGSTFLAAHAAIFRVAEVGLADVIWIGRAVGMSGNTTVRRDHALAGLAGGAAGLDVRQSGAVAIARAAALRIVVLEAGTGTHVLIGLTGDDWPIKRDVRGIRSVVADRVAAHQIRFPSPQIRQP